MRFNQANQWAPGGEEEGGMRPKDKVMSVHCTHALNVVLIDYLYFWEIDSDIFSVHVYILHRYNRLTDCAWRHFSSTTPLQCWDEIQCKYKKKKINPRRSLTLRLLCLHGAAIRDKCIMIRAIGVFLMRKTWWNILKFYWSLVFFSIKSIFWLQGIEYAVLSPPPQSTKHFFTLNGVENFSCRRRLSVQTVPGPSKRTSLFSIHIKPYVDDIDWFLW